MSDEESRPEIPAVAWRRPIGLPYPEAGHPRVHTPMIDDGTFAGIPIGGLGTGSIGRTHRGDAARWHLEVGRHAFAPVAADSFSVYVGSPGGAGSSDRPVDPPPRRPARLGLDAARRGWHLSRALPARLAGVRAGCPRRPPRRRAAEPGHRRRLRVERPPGRRVRLVGREPWAGIPSPSGSCCRGRTHRCHRPSPRSAGSLARIHRILRCSVGRSSTPPPMLRRVCAGRSPSRRPARPA